MQKKAVRKDETAVPKINIYYAQIASQVSIFAVPGELRVAMNPLTECNSIADRVRFICIPTRATA
jgi:hypothetical protein